MKARGSKLQVEIASVFTDIPKIRELTPPPITKERIDGTVLESTWDEADASLPMAGNCTFTILEDPANTVHAFLRTNAAPSETFLNWKVILPDGDTEAMSGKIVGWTPGALTPKGQREVTVDVMFTGPMTNS